MEPKKSVGAKEFTLLAQVIAALWIAFWNGSKFATAPLQVDTFDVIISGLAIAGCFAPVYVSIFLDKLANLKNMKG